MIQREHSIVKEEVALVSVFIHIHTNAVDTIGILPYPWSMAVVGLMDLVRARRLLLLYLLLMFLIQHLLYILKVFVLFLLASWLC